MHLLRARERRFASPEYTSAELGVRAVRKLLDTSRVDPGEVDLILSEAPSPDREVMRFKQRIDFAFIAAYSALFFTLAWLLMRAGGWGWVAGPAAMFCAAGAAMFDVIENRAILRILDVPLYRTTPQMLAAIRSASAAKWNLAGLTLAMAITDWRVMPLRKQSGIGVCSTPS